MGPKAPLLVVVWKRVKMLLLLLLNSFAHFKGDQKKNCRDKEIIFLNWQVKSHHYGLGP